MRAQTPRDPQHAVHPTASPNELEPSPTTLGTFAAGQSPLGEYRVTAEAGVGSFASGLTADDRPARS